MRKIILSVTWMLLWTVGAEAYDVFIINNTSKRIAVSMTSHDHRPDNKYTTKGWTYIEPWVGIGSAPRTPMAYECEDASWCAAFQTGVSQGHFFAMSEDGSYYWEGTGDEIFAGRENFLSCVSMDAKAPVSFSFEHDGKGNALWDGCPGVVRRTNALPKLSRSEKGVWGAGYNEEYWVIDDNVGPSSGGGGSGGWLTPQEWERKRTLEEKIEKERQRYEALQGLRSRCRFHDMAAIKKKNIRSIEAGEVSSFRGCIDEAEPLESGKEIAKRLLAEKEESEREKLAQAKLAKEKAEQEKLAKEKAAQEKLAQEKAEKEKAEKEELAREKAAKAEAEKEKLAKEKEKLEREKLAQEKLAEGAREKAEQEKPEDGIIDRLQNKIENFCFGAGTRVRTPEGLVSIETLKAGDLVVSCDFKGEKCALRPIVESMKSEVTTIIHMEVGAGSIAITPNHPVYVPRLREFVPVGEITAGETILTLGGEELVVTGLETENLAAPMLVYNLNIAGTHNYYVSSPTGTPQDILVHNCGEHDCAGVLNTAGEMFENLALGSTAACAGAVAGCAGGMVTPGGQVVAVPACPALIGGTCGLAGASAGAAIGTDALSGVMKMEGEGGGERQQVDNVGTQEALDSAKEITSKLSPGKIKTYISNVDQVPRQTLVKDMESIGLKLKGQGSPDGKFMEFIDHKGRVRAKIHPPDGVTTTNHLHIYDSNGNSLNRILEVVKKTSPDAHVPIQ